MTFITDGPATGLINDAATAGDWSGYSNFEPTLNNSSATLPNYIEGSACMFWPLKKLGGSGYAPCAGTSKDMSGQSTILVAWFFQTFADIANIPITVIEMRIASAATLATNAKSWDALDQLSNPKNAGVSGMVPIMGHRDNGTVVAGTPGYSSITYFGWYATTGNSNDGKQGWFDMIFVISYIGEHSATYSSSDFFDQLQAEAYDSDGSTWPVTSRPLGVISKSGSFYQINVNVQFASGSGDTSLTVVEEAKTVFFANICATHNVGYVFKNPATGTLSVTLTDIGHSWAVKQTDSGAEIFTDPENADTFKITGCSFSGGGSIDLPPDSATRWVRNTKFTSCNEGTATDGEFTDCILDGCDEMTVSGDADFSGTQILSPVCAADEAGLVWTGNYDPNGNLDNMAFSKGTNAHHAIEFGTATPTTMTLTGIDFSGFNATDEQNDSTLYIRRTTGTVTITLTDCTGTVSTKSSGATVVLVTGAVDVTQTVTSTEGVSIQSARILLKAKDGTGPLPFEDSVTISRSGSTVTVTHTSHGMLTGDKVVIEGANEQDYNGVHTITVTTVNAYTYTIAETPTTPATGTITSTYVALEGLTDVNGEITMSRSFSADQPVSGWARKSTSSPFYKSGSITGNIDSTDGYSGTVALVLDE